MTDPLPQLVLEGVFRELVTRHVPLGVRDYLDALRALELGFGGCTQQELRTLCHRLWARNKGEGRTIDLVFRLVPQTDADLHAAEELDRRLLQRDTVVSRTQAPGRGTPERTAAEPSSAQNAPRARVSFAPAGEAGGIPLPSLYQEPYRQETYLFHPQTVVSKRDLAVIWRRFRKLGRSGSKVELDLDATIREQSHTGVLCRAVLRPRRSNKARLIVLADVSPSMAPWRPFLQILANSLDLGQLRSAEVLYFSNVPRLPRGWLFRTSALNERTELDTVLKFRAGAALLVVSDAGAARGHFSPQRVEQTSRFLELVARYLRPIVWINPMPRQRWIQTSAAAIADDPRAVILPLDKESLIRAVDVLRGARWS